MMMSLTRRTFALALGSLALAACADDVNDPLAPDSAALASAAAAASEADVPPDSIFNRYIVQFRDGVGRSEQLSAELVGRHGGRRTRVFQHVLNGFAAVNLPPQAVEALRRNPNVLRIEEEKPVRMAGITHSNPGWALDRMDQATGLSGTFNYHFTGAGVHVYVIDTGIRGDHQEFSGRLGNGKSVIWFATNPYQDDQGHGTAVASAAAGSGMGPARGATVHSVRVATGEWAWPNDIIAGLDWVAANHAKPAVANLSFETGAFIDTAMENLINAGVVLTKAAGNKNADACDDLGNRVDRAIVVGALDITDNKASFSNWGSCIDVWAPGDDVMLAGNGGSGAYIINDGTSFSAPYVAGVVATMLQQRAMNSFTALNYVRSTGFSGVLGNVGSGSPNLLVNSLHQHASITGATDVVTGSTSVTRTWSPSTLGGDDVWGFRWEASVNGGAYQTVSYDRTYTRTIAANAEYSLNLRLVAWSAGRTVTATRYVSVHQPDPYGEEEPPCTNWKICP